MSFKREKSDSATQWNERSPLLSKSPPGRLQFEAGMANIVSASTIALNKFARGSSDHPFATRFKLRVYVTMFLYHVFLPFTVPLWWFCRGSATLRNHMILPLNPQNVFNSYFAPTGLWVLNGCIYYIFFHYEPPVTLFNMLVLVLVVNNILWLLRCAAIALKWSYSTPSLLSYLPQSEQCDSFHHENMFAWLEMTPAHIIQELYLSGLQNGVDIEHLYFRVESMSAVAVEACKAHNGKSTSSTTSISSSSSKKPGNEAAPSGSFVLPTNNHNNNHAFVFLGDNTQTESSSASASASTASDSTTSASASLPPAGDSEFGEALREVLFGEESVCLRTELEQMEILFQANRCTEADKKFLMTDSGCVPFVLVLLAMVRRASEPCTAFFRRNHYLAFVITGAVSLAPGIQRVVDGSLYRLLFDCGDPMWVSIVPLLLGTVLSWLNTYVLLRLLLGGIIDYYRRMVLSKICTDLISPRVVENYRLSKYEYPTVKVENSPLQLHYPENIVSWLACRTVLDVLGERYKSRAQIICSACLIYLVVFGVATFFTHLLISEKMYMGVLVCSNAVVTSACPALMAFFGMVANDQCSESRLQLKKQQIMLETVAHSAKFGPDAAPGLCIDLLSHASEVLSIEDEIRPLRIFGFKADPGFLRLLFGLLTSLASLFLNKYFIWD